MQRVTAVATTGVYCRPGGCGARPRPENVQWFPVAAAAEAAGYRACLRCRPYRTPLTADWTGPELVCRAVHLILDGALNEGDASKLAVRLGVSDRHLRRLFTAHLGVTPDRLARSDRAHFARRLLDDTDLTVTEIAFAAGFGSLRQFNRVFRQVFRATPGALRAKRRRSDHLAADVGLALRLAYDGPLDWGAMLHYLEAFAVPGVERVADGMYRRTIVIDGHPGVLELGPGGDDYLMLRVHLPRWSGLVHLVERARRIANLDIDLTEPTGRLTVDPMVGPLVRARPGVRTPGAWDPFEIGVRAIAGQRATRTTSTEAIGRLAERHGTAVSGLASIGLTHVFPGPNVLADADLSDVGLSAGEAASIRSFARRVAAGTIRLDRSVPLEQLVASIRSVDGIEPWAAHYLALRLGEPDACPTSDGDIEAGPDAPVAMRPTVVPRAAAERWRPWRALAVTHMWLSPCSAVLDVNGQGAA